MVLPVGLGPLDALLLELIIVLHQSGGTAKNDRNDDNIDFMDQQ